MKYLHALALLIALLVSSHVWAVEPDEMLPNPALEARARAISKELRCMVCQNELIDEFAGAARPRPASFWCGERIMAGDSDAQIINFLVSRYGEFILLKPPLSWHTVALWGAPPALLLLGILMIVVVERRRSTGRLAIGNGQSLRGRRSRGSPKSSAAIAPRDSPHGASRAPRANTQLRGNMLFFLENVSASDITNF